MAKKLTGEDVFKVRDCFQKGRDVKELITYAKIMLITQNLPNLSNADPAFLRRLLIVPFQYCFRNEGENGHDSTDPIVR